MNNKFSEASATALTTQDGGSVNSENVSLAGVLKMIGRNRWLILICTVGLSLAGLVVALWLPKSYDVAIVLSPTSSDAISGRLAGLSSALSPVSGLASIAGLSSGEGSKKSESLATLLSDAITERYISDNNLLPVLYRDLWDEGRHAWKLVGPEKVPTPWKATQFFKKRVRNVTDNAKTGIVTMTVTWRNPEVAANWANGLVALTNSYLRDKAIAQSEISIEYLTSQVTKTNVVELQQAIYALIATEYKKEMLARGTAEFAFKVIDPAIPPERPSSPIPMLYALLGAFLGLVLSFAIIGFRSALRSPFTPTNRIPS